MTTPNSNRLYLLGDIHGYLPQAQLLLQQAGIVGESLHWRGGDATLWFTGDLCDRGPDGVGAYDMVMRLQEEAAAAGGSVGCLLGNHDLALLAAYLMGDQPNTLKGGTYLRYWLRYGGIPSDLERLTSRHVDWLLGLPIMAREGDWLLIHADGEFYRRYGPALDEVNAQAGALMRQNDGGAWDFYLDDFTERHAFDRDHGEALDAFLASYGGSRLVHGHTPIPDLTGQPPATVTGPWRYAQGRAMNIDGGIYLGGPGFVVEVDRVAGGG